MASLTILPTSATGCLRVTNLRRGTVLAEQTSRACTFFARFRGLMGRSALPTGSGLLIEGDNAIHTCFMRFAIDVAFLDGQGQVLHLVHALPPWRVGRIVWRARSVLELPLGTLACTQTQVGDQLVFEPVKH